MDSLIRLESGSVVFENLKIFLVELEAEQKLLIFRHIGIDAELGEADGEVATDLAEQGLGGGVGEGEEADEQLDDFRI